MTRTSSLYLTVVAVLAIGIVGCGSKSTPIQPGPTCTFAVSPSALAFGAAAATNSITVTTAAGCAWSATSDRAWMSITSGSSGTGSGTVNVDLTANASSSERTGTLTIAGQPVTVKQDGLAPCAVQIAPESASLRYDDGSGAFSVSAADYCQWTVRSNASWITIRSASPGTGAGTVSYAVEKNTGAASRTGTIGVADRTFTVTQSGDVAPLCEYAVTPVTVNACMSVPYNLTAAITTQPGCTWTAEPDASWITLTSAASGAGSAVVTFKVSDNWDAPRNAAVKLRWPAVTAGQNVQVSQAGCRYAVSATAISVASGGGAGTFNVIQQSDPLECGGPLQNGCLWTAVADVPWITINTTMPQLGDNPVTFTVAPNGGGTRSGTITVRDQVVRVTQAGI